VVGPPTQLPLQDGVQGLTIQLLRSIEVDSLPAPAIDSTSQGTIRITWKHGHRMLFLSVMAPDRFLCGRTDGGVTLAVRAIRWNRVEGMRRLVS